MSVIPVWFDRLVVRIGWTCCGIAWAMVGVLAFEVLGIEDENARFPNIITGGGMLLFCLSSVTATSCGVRILSEDISDRKAWLSALVMCSPWLVFVLPQYPGV
ncbi:MAG: hypothetical protein KDN22_23705 [Verrucomicrobiae bacterium]|nr:hypothetical protein [Verrucomicrobiae bacterium]